MAGCDGRVVDIEKNDGRIISGIFCRRAFDETLRNHDFKCLIINADNENENGGQCHRPSGSTHLMAGWFMG